ncbi:MAG: hypothetical protein DYH08_06540 [Actinobacteria bacterium ATB1]|nr:hypothetical protein [Actinobacteria bacterium ATB1]
MERDWEIHVRRPAGRNGRGEDGEGDAGASGTVSLVTIERKARRNALSVELCRSLTESLRAEAETADVIVLTGAPPVFCAGADFSDFDAGPDRGGFVPAFNELLHALAHIPVPVIAWVNGAALGAGCQIVVQCDLAVAAESATFGITAARIGLQVDMVNVNRLVCEVGPRAARRLLLTGDVIPASEALALGLVDRVVPDSAGDGNESGLESGLDVTLHWAAELAGRAPLAVRGHKAAIQAVVDSWWLPEDSGAYRRSVESALAAFMSQDLREGLHAFSERRKPEFRGE